MNEIAGKDVLAEVMSGGVYIPYLCCKDVSISFAVELVNVTTQSSGRWNDYRPRRADWAVTISGVSTAVGNGRTIFTTVSPGNIFTPYPIRLTFSDEQGNSVEFTGTVLLQTATLTGNQDEFSQWENGLQGTGAYGLSVNGEVTPPVQKLLTPGLGAEPFSANQINLNWEIVPNASGYKLYYNIEPDFDTAFLVGAFGTGTNTYPNTGLNASTTYYYWLVAIGDGVAYTDSDPGEATATTLAGEAVFLLEWAYYDTDQHFSVVLGGTFVAQFDKTLTHGDPLSVDTETGPQGKYLVVRTPSVEGSKDNWFNSAFNNGTIPDTVWRKATNAPYQFYATRVPYYSDSAQKTILS